MAFPLHTALSMFTVIPLPPVMNWDERTTRHGVACLPLVGAVIGGISAGLAALVTWSGAGHIMAAAIALATWALLTGGFHLDGVADTNDGLASRKPAAEALAIMKQHDIGPMGVASIVLLLVVEMAALASNNLTGWRIVAVVFFAPIVGRLGSLEGMARWVPAARKDGMGSMYIGAITPVVYLVNVVLVLVASVGVGWLGVGVRGAIVFPVAVAVALLVGLVWRLRLTHRLGGMTGDTLGSLLEFTTLAFIITAALAC